MERNRNSVIDADTKFLPDSFPSVDPREHGYDLGGDVSTLILIQANGLVFWRLGEEDTRSDGLFLGSVSDPLFFSRSHPEIPFYKR